jgi:hypothetical protein
MEPSGSQETRNLDILNVKLPPERNILEGPSMLLVMNINSEWQAKEGIIRDGIFIVISIRQNKFFFVLLSKSCENARGALSVNRTRKTEYEHRMRFSTLT